MPQPSSITVFKSPKNPNSHLTVKEREGPSYPTKHLFKNHLIKGRTLDFGCGLGADVMFLREAGVDITAYDPYYVPENPAGRFDTIVCNYVLNVLLPEEQSYVLMAVSELLNPGGVAYFCVRRDIKQSGYRTHVKHKCQTYQCNVLLPYPSLFKNEFCEIYEYRPVNHLPSPKHSGCLLCAPPPEWELISESATVYAIINHPEDLPRILIVPKQHCENYFDLPERAKNACHMLIEHVHTLLVERYNTPNFRIEIPVGKPAGQEFDHAHIFLIPYEKHRSLQ